MFFFELRKRTKKRGEFGFSPHPLKPPLAEWGKGSTKNNKQKGFEKFWLKTFSFVFLFFVLHKTKNLSRVNVFECGCTQTLDKPFSFMQFGAQEELRQNLPQLLEDLSDESNKNISAYNSN